MIISDSASESDAALLQRLASLDVERVRLLTTATDQLRGGCFARGIEIDTQPVSVERTARAAPLVARAGDQPDNTPSRPRRAVSHGCSASAMGVLGGPCTKGHSSSAMRR